jgi:3-phosphoshikimate 1-carboxyvinyltransferase
MSDAVQVAGVGSLRGSLHVPGDKSGSHRALMLSALASGESTIEGLSAGRDVAATARIIEQLGARRSVHGSLTFVVGPDGGLHASNEPLDCGNSGTTMRLLAGLVSALPGRHLLVGDESLSVRPMDRIATPLALMGSSVTGLGLRVTAPLQIIGQKPLHPISYNVPMASAQVKSAVLLAGLGAAGPTSVHEDVRTRSTTEDMLRLCGVDVASHDDGAGRRVTVHPGRPSARQWSVPGDPSQAAFFAVLGCIHRDAEIEIVDIDASEDRCGFLQVLQRMGANLTVRANGATASFVVKSSALLATEITAEEIPSVDEVPVLTVAAAAATGTSAFRHMGELRLKESDRFDGALVLATALGCRAWADGDDFFVEGLGSAERFSEFTMHAHLDHRMVMASAVAAIAGGGCTIDGAQTVASSYPQFFDDVASLQ